MTCLYLRTAPPKQNEKEITFPEPNPGKKGPSSVFRSWLREKWYAAACFVLGSWKMIGQHSTSAHLPAYLHVFPVSSHLNSCPVVVVRSINCRVGLRNLGQPGGLLYRPQVTRVPQVRPGVLCRGVRESKMDSGDLFKESPITCCLLPPPPPLPSQQTGQLRRSTAPSQP